MTNFSAWWAALPSKMKQGSKPRAQSRYNAILAAGDGKLLELALEGYKADQAANPWRDWMYAATFLGRWRDYVMELERGELLDFDDGGLTHYLCNHCLVPHSWETAGIYSTRREMACPKAVQAMLARIKAASGEEQRVLIAALDEELKR